VNKTSSANVEPVGPQLSLGGKRRKNQKEWTKTKEIMREAIPIRVHQGSFKGGGKENVRFLDGGKKLRKAIK